MMECRYPAGEDERLDGGTNIGAGLMLAEDLLTQAGVTDGAVILLGDMDLGCRRGAPTSCEGQRELHLAAAAQQLLGSGYTLHPVLVQAGPLIESNQMRGTSLAAANTPSLTAHRSEPVLARTLGRLLLSP